MQIAVDIFVKTRIINFMEVVIWNEFFYKFILWRNRNKILFEHRSVLKGRRFKGAFVT